MEGVYVAAIEDRGVAAIEDRVEDAIEDCGVSRSRIEVSRSRIAVSRSRIAVVVNNYKRPKFCPLRRSIGVRSLLAKEHHD